MSAFGILVMVIVLKSLENFCVLLENNFCPLMPAAHYMTRRSATARFDFTCSHRQMCMNLSQVWLVSCWPISDVFDIAAMPNGPATLWPLLNFERRRIRSSCHVLRTGSKKNLVFWSYTTLEWKGSLLWTERKMELLGYPVRSSACFHCHNIRYTCQHRI